MITKDTLLEGLKALDIHPKSGADLPEDRMAEVIEGVLVREFEIAFECPTCGKDLPECDRCFYCAEFFDGIEAPEKKSKRWAAYKKVNGERLLDKLIRFFPCSEVRRGKTVVSFWQDGLGVLIRVHLQEYSLKIDFPFELEQIANAKKLGLKNYTTPREGCPCRLHIRHSSQISPDLLDALNSCKSLRAQTRITAPEFRNKLEAAALAQVLREQQEKESQ